MAPRRLKAKAWNPTVKPLPTTPPAIRATATSGAVSIEGRPLNENATAHVIHYWLQSRGV